MGPISHLLPRIPGPRPATRPGGWDPSRGRTGLPGGGLLLLLLCVAPAAGQEPPPADTTVENPGRVVGRVEDRESGGPVGTARIRLLPLGGAGRVVSEESDSAGYFSFPGVEAGEYRIQATRLGYREVADTLEVPAHGETRVEISMVPDAVDLEPLVVTAVQREPGFLRELRARRELGFGHFVTRDEIEARNPSRVTDLLRRMPGVRIVPGSQFRDAAVLMRGRCRPRLWIDGVPVWSEMSIDQILVPVEVEAIEVYSAATIPPRFGRNACGVVVVWTRVPRRPTEGGGSFWKRLGIVAGLVLGAVILTN